VSISPEIIVTTQDFERLQRLLRTHATPLVDRLEDELARAELVAPSDVPANVVTMNSEVVYEEVLSGVRRVIRLVYPKDADSERGLVSVLAPLGSAIFGLAAGQEIEWTMPRGVRRVRIVAVPYQPEAHGDMTL
jgi:regulator of nucleoside diphosphate kinase